MTPQDYFESCARTWNNSLSTNEQIANATMGIVGEVGEFTECPHDPLEAGDVYYYIATFLRLCDVSPNRIDPGAAEPMMSSVPGTLRRTTELAESVKKWLYHGKGDCKEAAIECVILLARTMHALCEYNNWNVHEIWQQNIDKLKERWPDGFAEGDNRSDQ